MKNFKFLVAEAGKGKSHLFSNKLIEMIKNGDKVMAVNNEEFDLTEVDSKYVLLFKNAKEMISYIEKNKLNVEDYKFIIDDVEITNEELKTLLKMKPKKVEFFQQLKFSNKDEKDNDESARQAAEEALNVFLKETEEQVGEISLGVIENLEEMEEVHVNSGLRNIYSKDDKNIHVVLGKVGSGKSRVVISKIKEITANCEKVYAVSLYNEELSMLEGASNIHLFDSVDELLKYIDITGENIENAHLLIDNVLNLSELEDIKNYNFKSTLFTCQTPANKRKYDNELEEKTLEEISRLFGVQKSSIKLYILL